MIASLVAGCLMGQASSLIFKLDMRAVDESSGVAISPTQPNVYYTHNDSGDTARFFRFDQAGHVTGVFDLVGAQAVDWEDMASAMIDRRSSLFFGDIGDNLERRTSIRVYRVDEPRGAAAPIKRYDTYTLRYPDGAHNCETLMIDKARKQLVLVTKNPDGVCGVYTVSIPKRSGEYTLTRAGTLRVNGVSQYDRLVTAGDISPDGKMIALRTYMTILEIPMSAEWWNSKPHVFPAIHEQQGEAICFTADGSSLITTSEGVPCPVSRVVRAKG